MIIEKLSSIYLEEAARLAFENYREEINKIPSLPSLDNAFEMICGYLEKLMNNGLGVAAIEKGNLKGYLTGIPLNNMFGIIKGIFCPIHAHGAVKDNKKSIYQRLYQKAGELWVKNDILSHGIALYAHDDKAVNTLFWSGFGLRCIDAVRDVEEINVQKLRYDIIRIEPDYAELVHPMELKLVKHLNASPAFMPIYKELSAERLKNWLSKKNNYIWAAFYEDKVVAYIKLTEKGENFITEAPSMMNICGAYTIPELRGTGVSTQLLSYVIRFLKDNGFNYCGVDFESFNLAGSGFWMKYFNAYTFSVVRRIDERITRI